MYYIVDKNNAFVVTANTTDIGKYDTQKVSIYYIADSVPLRYHEGKFYTYEGEEYTGEVVDVTDQYTDLSHLSTSVAIGTTIELDLPQGDYEVYYEHTLAAKFSTNGASPKQFTPRRAGRYKFVLTSKPCNPFVIYATESVCEII